MPMVITAAVLVVLVLGFVAWRFFRPTTQTYSAQEQQQIQGTIEDQYRQFGGQSGMPVAPAQQGAQPGMPYGGR